MIYNKNNFSIHNLEDKHSGNMVHNIIHVTKEFTEITNGHYAVRVYAPYGDYVDSKAEDLPNVGEGMGVKKDFESCVIAVNVAKEIEKAIPKMNTLPVLENAWITEHTDKEHVEFCTTDLEITRPIRARVEDIKYPDIDNVQPKGQPEFKIAFNAEYMLKICQQFKRMDIKTVAIDFFGENGVMKIFGKTTDMQKIEVLLMPMKR